MNLPRHLFRTEHKQNGTNGTVGTVVIVCWIRSKLAEEVGFEPSRAVVGTRGGTRILKFMLLGHAPIPIRLPGLHLKTWRKITESNSPPFLEGTAFKAALPPWRYLPFVHVLWCVRERAPSKALVALP